MSERLHFIWDGLQLVGPILVLLILGLIAAGLIAQATTAVKRRRRDRAARRQRRIRSADYFAEWQPPVGIMPAQQPDRELDWWDDWNLPGYRDEYDGLTDEERRQR